MVLPRMAFEIINIKYDGDRKLSTVGKIYNKKQRPNVKSVYSPVPYNFDFNLYIMVRNAEDGARILEQILPFFTPAWGSTVNLIPEMDIKHDIPIILHQVSSEDLYEGNFETRRALVWTLRFELKGYLYGPTTDSGLIKNVLVNFYTPKEDLSVAPGGNTSILETISIKPGLTANGLPTSNTSNSIDYNLINANDNYDFIVEFLNGDIEQ